ncbi:dihydrolipoamide acetyltransferase family protein [Nonomuraea sp. M3C6]|uniref:Dihydrolipoamide acetyltransferase component of pyruvate dehydrogenase complex n=1 Tax=Nonomuraea marmarensis TaxID=3351344 RepID=A0ABW7ATE4_9ACTN
MARLLRMPEVAANATEAVLQGWAVAVDTPFAAGDVIATVETDKAVVDVEAEADGVLLRPLAAEGATLAVGTAIAIVGDLGEHVDDLDRLVTDLTTAASDGAATRPGRAAPDRPARLFSSPLARRLAREARLPIEDITGTGPNGRIIRRDVEAAIEHRTTFTPRDTPVAAHQAPAEPAPASRIPAEAPVSRIPDAAVAARQGPETSPGAVTEVPHTRARQAIASRLTTSKQTTPHFYLRGTAHVGKLLELRRHLNEGAQRKISINDLVIKAVAHAHQRVPDMNVIWTPEATRQFGTVDLSVAIATDRGLVTPVLRSVEQQSVMTIADATQDFAKRARAGRLRQGELEGGVLTVTNLGMFGVEEFAAIINPPQSAILAVGAVRQEPVVKGGKLKAGEVMRVTLSVDHRPIDGTVAAAWMQAFLELLADPVRILA